MKATHTPPTTDHQPGMSPAELLRGAALYLWRHGWMRGDFFDLLDDQPFPRACALGAINICAHGRPILGSDDTAEDALTDAAIRAMRVLAGYLDPDYDTGDSLHASAIDIVAAYNDQEHMTAEEIVDTLRKAAHEWDRTHPAGSAR